MCKIFPVDAATLEQAATIHSVSWKQSHRAFCTPEFVASHTVARQMAYLNKKIENGTKLFLLIDEVPVGIVSVTGSLIEDLYVHPDFQNKGYGTKLLQFAIGACAENPTLWILENNHRAEKLYRRTGFHRTGRRNSVTNGLDEIELEWKT